MSLVAHLTREPHLIYWFNLKNSSFICTLHRFKNYQGWFRLKTSISDNVAISAVHYPELLWVCSLGNVNLSELERGWCEITNFWTLYFMHIIFLHEGLPLIFKYWLAMNSIVDIISIFKSRYFLISKINSQNWI